MLSSSRKRSSKRIITNDPRCRRSQKDVGMTGIEALCFGQELQSTRAALQHVLLLEQLAHSVAKQGRGSRRRRLAPRDAAILMLLHTSPHRIREGSLQMLPPLNLLETHL
jgi:hypothetical protein